MTLIPCSLCGSHHFSTERCPHCSSGTRQRKNIGLLLGLGLAACGDDGLKDTASMEPEYGAAWIGVDMDGDGFFEDEDCDDENADINPEAEEIPDDGIDSNCNEDDNT
jgi:hypothetical protein